MSSNSNNENNVRDDFLEQKQENGKAKELKKSFSDEQDGVEVDCDKENDEEEFRETCSCGNNRYHHMVSPETTYTAWGAFWITIMGVSAKPIRVDFSCRICKEKFDFEIDPEQLENFY